MPEGLLFRGKYVGKTRNTLGIDYSHTKNTVDYRSEVKSRVNSSLGSRTPKIGKRVINAQKSVTTLANNTLNCPTTVVGGDRPKSTMLYLKRGKSQNNTKRFVPEEYFKKCGYRYDPTQAK